MGLDGMRKDLPVPLWDIEGPTCALCLDGIWKYLPVP